MGAGGTRRLGWVAFAIAFGWAAPARALPAPFVPRVGDTLRYALSNGDSATTRVVRVRAQGEQTYAFIERTLSHEGEERVSHYTLVRSNAGVALALPEPEGMPFERTPWICYLTKATPEDTWTAQRGRYETMDGDMVDFAVEAELVGVETVEVPAGKFSDCMHLRYRCRTGTTPHADSLEVWFSPAVGLVRTLTVGGDRPLETTLVEVAGS